ncbi:hypothetical protein OG900_26515 [Streptomyces sp. NBC_00433]
MSWNFHWGPHYVLVEPPSGVDAGLARAVEQFLHTEISGRPSTLTHYRDTWREVRAAEDPELTEISGNATVQRLEGDRVVFEALYDQWPDTSMSVADFENLLSSFQEFLEGR